MTRKKAIKHIEKLEEEERKYFDTFRPSFTDRGKVKHLREMADVIEEKMNLREKYNIKNK